MKTSKNVMLEIKGGFGNQLFQYAFGNFLQENGIKVKINNLWYSKENKFPREEIFNPSFYGFEITSKFDQKKYEIIDRYFSKSKLYYKTDQEIRDIDALKKFNWLNGYYQNIKFLNFSKQFLFQTLMKNETLSEGLQFLGKDNKVMIHVRKGDYVGLEEDLKDNYYKTAINLSIKEIKNCSFDLFTDDIESINQSKLLNYVENVFTSSNSNTHTIEAFSGMLKYKNFILSNSTFSLIPAFLKKEESSVIFIPYPWMLKKSKNYDLYDEDFRKISRD